MNISIVGTGYVGLTMGALLAAAGNKVYCIDVDPNKIESIKKGKAYFFEPGLDEFVAQGVKSGNLIPTLSYKEAIPKSEIAIISVGTPTNPDGSLNLSYIFEAVDSIGEYMEDGLIIVQKSTVPVGTGRKIMETIEGKGKQADVVSCPEFLAESSAVFDTFNLDRLVVGSDNKKANSKVAELFRSIDELGKKLDMSKYKEFAGTYKDKVEMNNKTPFEQRVLNLGLESAEMVKITANAYLATKISFANSIARICDKVDADVSEVMNGIGMDKRIGRDFLFAGLGWGGGCFPKDTAGLLHLANDNDFDFAQLEATISVNSSQVDYIVGKIKTALNGNLKDKQIGILGLAFKPGTSDARESRAIMLANRLAKGGAKVLAYDPKAMKEAKHLLSSDINLINKTDCVFDHSELVVLATDWPEFQNMDFALMQDKMETPIILDARNKLDKNAIETAGYHYIGIGR